jgi:uncharacterized membrane protein YjgN (DUF898 family)
MDFVKVWLATLLVFVLTLIVFALAAALLVGGSSALLPQLKQMGLFIVLLILFAAVFGVLLVVAATAPARAYREARMFRLVWDNVGVSQVARFKCHLRPGAYVWLRIRNMLLTLLTLGLYRPFARVSEYRMKLESVTLHVKGSVDQVAGVLVKQQQGGLGDALADAVGLDLIG